MGSFLAKNRESEIQPPPPPSQRANLMIHFRLPNSKIMLFLLTKTLALYLSIFSQNIIFLAEYKQHLTQPPAPQPP